MALGPSCAWVKKANPSIVEALHFLDLENTLRLRVGMEKECLFSVFFFFFLPLLNTYFLASNIVCDSKEEPPGEILYVLPSAVGQWAGEVGPRDLHCQG